MLCDTAGGEDVESRWSTYADWRRRIVVGTLVGEAGTLDGTAEELFKSEGLGLGEVEGVTVVRVGIGLVSVTDKLIMWEGPRDGIIYPMS